MNLNSPPWRWPLAILSLLASSSMRAEPTADSHRESAQLELSAGRSYGIISPIAGLLITPHWIPYLDASYTDDNFFANLQTGIGYKIINRQTLNVGFALDYQYGRQQSADARYRGLGNVPGAPAPALSIEWQPFGAALDIFVETKKSIGGAGAWNYTLDVSSGLPLTAQLNVFIDVIAMGGDAHYAQKFYGITPAQAVASGYAVYTPSAGFGDITTMLGIQYKYSPHWLFTAGLGRLHYFGSVADSPIIDRSSYGIGNLFATYKF